MAGIAVVANANESDFRHGASPGNPGSVSRPGGTRAEREPRATPIICRKKAGSNMEQREGRRRSAGWTRTESHRAGSSLNAEPVEISPEADTARIGDRTGGAEIAVAPCVEQDGSDDHP